MGVCDMNGQKNDPDLVDAEARRWVVQMTSEGFSMWDRARLSVWLEADPRHQRAFADAERVWTGVAQLDHLRGKVGVDDLDRFAVRPPKRKFRWLSSFPAAAAAGLAAAAILSLAIVNGIVTLGTPSPDQYVTEVAEIRSIILDDGSEITLGALSEVEVEFLPNERRAVLISGEAFFSIATDPERPFFVVADDAEVRVIGTKFEVRRSSEGVRVTVEEGIVEVSRQSDRGKNAPLETNIAAKTILTSGEMVIAASRGTLELVQEASTVAPGAWRSGRLFYENARLADVISDVRRYYGADIGFDSNDVANLRLTGSFRTDHIDQMFAQLEQALPVAVQKMPSGRILIRKE